MNDIGAKLQREAEAMLDTIARGEASLETRLDVFKVVSAYHLGLLRQSKPQPDDDGDGPSFRIWRERAKLENGVKSDA